VIRKKWSFAVSILDWFKPSSSAPKGSVEIKVKFTADETEAISHTLDRYAAIANAHAPEGTRMFVPPKVRNAMSAQGLTEYAEDLIREVQDCASGTKAATLLDKAEFSQLYLRAQDEFTPDQIDAVFLEKIETVHNLEKEGAERSSALKYELDRILVAKRLHDSGLLRFSEGR
jgi:hypothetical protein